MAVTIMKQVNAHTLGGLTGRSTRRNRRSCRGRIRIEVIHYPVSYCHRILLSHISPHHLSDHLKRKPQLHRRPQAPGGSGSGSSAVAAITTGAGTRQGVAGVLFPPTAFAKRAGFAGIPNTLTHSTPCQHLQSCFYQYQLFPDRFPFGLDLFLFLPLLHWLRLLARCWGEGILTFSTQPIKFDAKGMQHIIASTTCRLNQ